MILGLLFLIILLILELLVLSLPSAGILSVFLRSSLVISPSAVIRYVILLLLIFLGSELIYRTFNSSWDTLRFPLLQSIFITIGLILVLFIGVFSVLKDWDKRFFVFLLDFCIQIFNHLGVMLTVST